MTRACSCDETSHRSAVSYLLALFSGFSLTVASGKFDVSGLKVFFDNTSARVAAGLYVLAGNSIIHPGSPQPFGPVNVVPL